jgi:hypothetical protein
MASWKFAKWLPDSSIGWKYSSTTAGPRYATIYVLFGLEAEQSAG